MAKIAKNDDGTTTLTLSDDEAHLVTAAVRIVANWYKSAARAVGGISGIGRRAALLSDLHLDLAALGYGREKDVRAIGRE